MSQHEVSLRSMVSWTAKKYQILPQLHIWTLCLNLRDTLYPPSPLQVRWCQCVSQSTTLPTLSGGSPVLTTACLNLRRMWHISNTASSRMPSLLTVEGAPHCIHCFLIQTRTILSIWIYTPWKGMKTSRMLYNPWKGLSDAYHMWHIALVFATCTLIQEKMSWYKLANTVVCLCVQCSYNMRYSPRCVGILACTVYIVPW